MPAPAMRRGSSRKKKEKECSSEKTPTVSFTQPDGYIRYPDYSEASSVSALKPQSKRMNALKLQEKPVMLGGEDDGEVLDYSQKEGEGQLDSARLTYRIWGDGQLCENKRPYEEVKFCFLCDLETTELRHGTRMTGEKLDGNGGMYPIYRHLFMCQQCFDKSPRTKKVLITSKALKTYYSCDQK